MCVPLGSLASFWRGLGFVEPEAEGCLDDVDVGDGFFVAGSGLGEFWGFSDMLFDEVVLPEGGCCCPHGGVASVMATSSVC